MAVAPRRSGDAQAVTRAGSSGNLSFRLDVSEKPDAYVVKADLPGIPKDNVHVHLENGVLSLEAEKKESKDEKGETYHIQERSYGKYRRSVRLPKPIDEDKVGASFENGVLSITIPKVDKSSKARRIAIN